MMMMMEQIYSPPRNKKKKSPSHSNKHTGAVSHKLFRFTEAFKKATKKDPQKKEISTKNMSEGSSVPSLKIINVADGKETTLDKLIGDSTAVIDHYTTW